MSRLPESFAISVDGYGAGPKQSVDNPLGVGGVALYEWAFATQTFQKMLGNAGGATGVDDDFAERGFSNVGAWIIGCNMFGPIRGDSRVRAQRLPFYWELGSVFKGRPSVDTNRRSGDSVDSFDADWADCDVPDGTPPHMFGQSSMGRGASNIDGGIIALNCTNAALLLNSGHPCSGMQWPQRFETNARFL